MTKATLKKKLYKAIEEIQDESLLKAFYTILQANKPSEEFADALFKKELEQAEKEIKKGKTIPHEQVRKMAEKW